MEKEMRKTKRWCCVHLVAVLAFAAMMDKDYGISKAQAVKMMDIAYEVNGATK